MIVDKFLVQLVRPQCLQFKSSLDGGHRGGDRLTQMRDDEGRFSQELLLELGFLSKLSLYLMSRLKDQRAKLVHLFQVVFDTLTRNALGRSCCVRVLQDASKGVVE